MEQQRALESTIKLIVKMVGGKEVEELAECIRSLQNTFATVKSMGLREAVFLELVENWSKFLGNLKEDVREDVLSTINAVDHKLAGVLLAGKSATKKEDEKRGIDEVGGEKKTSPSKKEKGEGGAVKAKEERKEETGKKEVMGGDKGIEKKGGETKGDNDKKVGKEGDKGAKEKEDKARDREGKGKGKGGEVEEVDKETKEKDDKKIEKDVHVDNDTMIRSHPGIQDWDNHIRKADLPRMAKKNPDKILMTLADFAIEYCSSLQRLRLPYLIDDEGPVMDGLQDVVAAAMGGRKAFQSGNEERPQMEAIPIGVSTRLIVSSFSSVTMVGTSIIVTKMPTNHRDALALNGILACTAFPILATEEGTIRIFEDNRYLNVECFSAHWRAEYQWWLELPGDRWYMFDDKRRIIGRVSVQEVHGANFCADQVVNRGSIEGSDDLDEDEVLTEVLGATPVGSMPKVQGAAPDKRDSNPKVVQSDAPKAPPPAETQKKTEEPVPQSTKKGKEETKGIHDRQSYNKEEPHTNGQANKKGWNLMDQRGRENKLTNNSIEKQETEKKEATEGPHTISVGSINGGAEVGVWPSGLSHSTLSKLMELINKDKPVSEDPDEVNEQMRVFLEGALHTKLYRPPSTSTKSERELAKEKEMEGRFKSIEQSKAAITNSISNELREKIERNKRQAEERRQRAYNNTTYTYTTTQPPQPPPQNTQEKTDLNRGYEVSDSPYVTKKPQQQHTQQQSIINKCSKCGCLGDKKNSPVVNSPEGLLCAWCRSLTEDILNPVFKPPAPKTAPPHTIQGATPSKGQKYDKAPTFVRASTTNTSAQHSKPPGFALASALLQGKTTPTKIIHNTPMFNYTNNFNNPPSHIQKAPDTQKREIEKAWEDIEDWQDTMNLDKCPPFEREEVERMINEGDAPEFPESGKSSAKIIINLTQKGLVKTKAKKRKEERESENNVTTTNNSHKILEGAKMNLGKNSPKKASTKRQRDESPKKTDDNPQEAKSSKERKSKTKRDTSPKKKKQDMTEEEEERVTTTQNETVETGRVTKEKTTPKKDQDIVDLETSEEEGTREGSTVKQKMNKLETKHNELVGTKTTDLLKNKEDSDSRKRKSTSETFNSSPNPSAELWDTLEQDFKSTRSTRTKPTGTEHETSQQNSLEDGDPHKTPPTTPTKAGKGPGTMTGISSRTRQRMLQRKEEEEKRRKELELAQQQQAKHN